MGGGETRGDSGSGESPQMGRGETGGTANGPNMDRAARRAWARNPNVEEEDDDDDDDDDDDEDDDDDGDRGIKRQTVGASISFFSFIFLLMEARMLG